MPEKPSQTELDLKLVNLVAEGDVTGVKELLAQGASANVIGIMNAPVLMTAINSKDVALVKMLVDAGADVNYKMTVDFGFGASITDTPLKRAKDSGVKELVDILTAAGAK